MKRLRSFEWRGQWWSSLAAGCRFAHRRSESLGESSPRMNHFVARHLIHCDEKTFWKLFFSREVNARMYAEVLKFPAFSIVEEREDEVSLVRKAVGRPRVHALPEAVQKMLGSSFQYVEESTFEKAARRWRWKMMPSHMPDRLRNEGVLWIEPAGQGRITRVADVRIEAKIFGVGKILEGLVEKEIRAGWDESAAFLNKWLAEHPEEVRASL